MIFIVHIYTFFSVRVSHVAKASSRWPFVEAFAWPRNPPPLVKAMQRIVQTTAVFRHSWIEWHMELYCGEGDFFHTELCQLVVPAKYFMDPSA